MPGLFQVTTDEELKYFQQRYEQAQLLSDRGLTGDVWSYVDHGTEPASVVAIKFMPTDGNPLTTTATRRRDGQERPPIQAADPTDIANELALMMRTNHPNLVKYKNAYYFPARHNIAVVMENVAGGSLRKMMRRAEMHHEQITAQQFWALAMQLFGALSHLHGHDLVHRDIKPANIMMRDPLTPVLVDAGFLCQLHPVAPGRLCTTDWMGTRPYMAPEVYTGAFITSGGTKVLKAADVYALSAVLYEVVTGKLPQRDAHIQLPEQEGTVQLQYPTGVPPDIQLYLAHGLANDWQKRPPAEEMRAMAMQHFLNEYRQNQIWYNNASVRPKISTEKTGATNTLKFVRRKK